MSSSKKNLSSEELYLTEVLSGEELFFKNGFSKLAGSGSKVLKPAGNPMFSKHSKN
jgi:hypothetical protein